MDTLTLTQAGEGRSSAARMVSVRAAVPFFTLTHTGDLVTYGGILFFIAFIAYMVHGEIRNSRKKADIDSRTIKHERNHLEKRIAERTRELITAETERLNELNRTVQFGELSRGLFHDLMSPLASISMYMDKLGSRTPESAEAKEVVDKVVAITQRMSSYMESVRRCIGNVPELSAEACADLSQEFSIVNDILGYKSRTAGVDLIVEHCPSVSIPIHPIRLHQLLLNLTSNAIDACVEARYTDPSHEATVILSAQHTPQDITITVRDTGCGMTPRQMETLFTRPVSTKSHGLGIGMRTVKTIVEDELGGKIQVASVPGSGTTFTITIQQAS